MALLTLLASAKPATAESHDPPLSDELKLRYQCQKLAGLAYLLEYNSPTPGDRDEAKDFTLVNGQENCDVDPAGMIKFIPTEIQKLSNDRNYRPGVSLRIQP